MKPEVYMISDQGQALEKANLFVDSNSRRKMQVRVKEKYHFLHLGQQMLILPLLWQERIQPSLSLNFY